jgi:hypothetical protein
VANWLKAQCEGTTTTSALFFTEPNLEFYRLSARSIRVAFAIECAPPWAKQGDRWRLHGFSVPIGPALAEAAAQLQKQLAEFPQRGAEG